MGAYKLFGLIFRVGPCSRWALIRRWVVNRKITAYFPIERFISLSHIYLQKKEFFHYLSVFVIFISLFFFDCLFILYLIIFIPVYLLYLFPSCY